MQNSYLFIYLFICFMSYWFSLVQLKNDPHALLCVWVCANASAHMSVFVLSVRVCTRVILFVSSVNYLENWQCLSIVDGSGKYVSLEQLFGGNLFQHLSALEIKRRKKLIIHVPRI